MSVRDLLLVYDYTEAVSLLMKLPSNISVSYILSFALHLKAGTPLFLFLKEIVSRHMGRPKSYINLA
jgi:hypothetical protein